MARFPYVPGAGAKNIGNPVYWGRMTIQNERYRQKSENAKALFWKRYNGLWAYYDKVWEEELEKVRNFLSGDEEEKLYELNAAFKSMDKEMADNPYLDNSQLNKLKTRLKNFILFTLKKCIKYKIYNNLNSVVYDTKIKAFVFNGNKEETDMGLW
tara:strand:+ start:96 stop:560 length:465 start_codon:yes stop_codon:yes gene_type:complete